MGDFWGLRAVSVREPLRKRFSYCNGSEWLFPRLLARYSGVSHINSRIIGPDCDKRKAVVNTDDHRKSNNDLQALNF